MVHVKYTKIKNLDQLQTLETGAVVMLDSTPMRYSGSIDNLLIFTSRSKEDGRICESLFERNSLAPAQNGGLLRKAPPVIVHYYFGKGPIHQHLNQLQNVSMAGDYDENAYDSKDKRLRAVNL